MKRNEDKSENQNDFPGTYQKIIFRFSK